MPRRIIAKRRIIAHPTKIATCCYCGTRAALVLGESGRHELSCGQCGAPLHALKMLPSAAAPKRCKPAKLSKASKPVKVPKPVKRSKPKAKRRKSRWGDLFEDAFDLIEDIFD